MKIKFLVILSVLLVPLFFAFSAFAQQNLASGNTVVLKRDQTINSDYFATGESVTISGTVNGDAYVAGGNILIDGRINGDLLVAGGTVTIRGTITDDVRAAGGNITVSGNIGKNITAAGGDVHITDAARIAGSLTSGAGNVSVFAPIGRGITVGAGNVTIGSAVNGTINAGVGNLTLTPDARINGNINYWSEANAQVSPGASVSGQITHNIPQKQPQITAQKTTEFFAKAALFWKLISFTSALVVGLLLLRFFPQFTEKAAQTALDSPLKSILIGFIALVVTPIAVIILLVTVLGIPLALVLLVLYWLALYTAKIIVGLATGIWVANRSGWKRNIGWVFVLGLLLYYIVTSIPVIGWIIGFFAMLLGLGALLIYKLAYYREMQAKKLI